MYHVSSRNHVSCHDGLWGFPYSWELGSQKCTVLWELRDWVVHMTK